jgi:oxaloacetate decarboxylase alpha subunit
MVYAFRGTEYDTGIDMEGLNKIAAHFKPIREKYIASGLLDPKLMGVDINTLVYQVPGGMLSNLVSQLKQSNAMDKFEDVLREVPRVREDLGYPPLVTPSSQIVGTQAVLNVVSGERYKMVPRELKQVVIGMYGRTTVPISDEVFTKIARKNAERITVRPADLLEPELENTRKQFAEYIEKEEDVLTGAMFPEPALKFFQQRNAQKYKTDEDILNKEDKVYPV